MVISWCTYNSAAKKLTNANIPEAVHNLKLVVGFYKRIFLATPKNNIDWLQVDYLKQKTIYGVVTTGRPNVAQWVTKYRISYGDNPNALTFIKDAAGADKVKRILCWWLLFQGWKIPTFFDTNLFGLKGFINK